MLQDSNHVSAFILASLNGTISLQLHRANEYANYGFGSLTDTAKNAEKLAVQFMMLDFKTFGHDRFNIFDNRLLNDLNLPFGTIVRNKTVHICERDAQQSRTSGYEVWTYDVCTSYLYLDCTTNHSCCPDGSCGACQELCWKQGSICEQVSILVYVDYGNWNTGGSGTIGGGGGSDGVVPPGYYVCNPNPYIDNGYPPCDNGGNPGWLSTELIQNISIEQDDNLADDDPNLIWWNYLFTDTVVYTPQARPSFQNMYNNYPKLGNDDLPVDSVCKIIGGQVLSKYINGNIQNAYALRISRALNYSGVNIPNIPGQTWQGADGKNYFYWAMHLYKFCLKTFGDPEIHKTSADGGVNGSNFRNQLISIQNRGIYIMKPKSQKDFKASGHTTLWGGLDCIGGHNYFAAESDIYIWRLN